MGGCPGQGVWFARSDEQGLLIPKPSDLSTKAMESQQMSRFQEAVERIDAANARDPNRVEGPGGSIAKELLYGQRMTRTLQALVPNADELLRLACRASHICRWESLRTDFPEGRAGYKKWRSQLLVHHAALASSILAETGYSPDEQARVATIIQKRGREQDAEVQTLEDVACLVFLEYEFDAFIAKHEDEKLAAIVRKTWSKMSDKAHQYALTLSLGSRAEKIVAAALAEAVSP